MSNYNPNYFAPHVPVNTKWYGVDGAMYDIAKAFYTPEVQRQYLRYAREHHAGIITYERRRHISPELIIDFNTYADTEWMDVFVTEEGVKRMFSGDMAFAIHFRESSDTLAVDLTYLGTNSTPNVTNDEALAWSDATFEWRSVEGLEGQLFCICPTYAQAVFQDKLTGFIFRLEAIRDVPNPITVQTYQYRLGSWTFTLDKYMKGYWTHYDHYPAYDYFTVPPVPLTPPAYPNYGPTSTLIEQDDEWAELIANVMGFIPPSVYRPRIAQYMAIDTDVLYATSYRFNSAQVRGLFPTAFDSGTVDASYIHYTARPGSGVYTWDPYRTATIRTLTASSDTSPVPAVVLVAGSFDSRQSEPRLIGQVIREAMNEAKRAGKSVTEQLFVGYEAFKTFEWTPVNQIAIPQAPSAFPRASGYKVTNTFPLVIDNLDGTIGGGRVDFTAKPYEEPAFFDFLDGDAAWQRDNYGV